MNIRTTGNQLLVCIPCQEASKQPVSSVVTGEDPTLLSSRSSVCNKNLGGGQRTSLNNFVFPNTMTELNQKLTKSMPRRCSIRAVYTREKHLCTNLGVKEEGGHLLKGSYFQEITVHT